MKLYLIIVLLLVFVSFSFGQSPPSSASPNASQTSGNEDEKPIKVDTLLINIPVIASDRDGRYISGLKKEDFSIFQNGIEQEIAFFAGEEAPMNVAILIDTSFSTSEVLENIKSAAHEFVKTFRREDKAMVVTFDYQMKILTEFTSNLKKIDKAINKAEIASSGGSDMQDAMYQLVKKNFASVKGRKAIIVLTDGFVSGRIPDKELLYTLSESDILIYPIIFKTKATISSANLPEQTKLPDGKIITCEGLLKHIENLKIEMMKFITTLGPVTGGRLFQNDSSDFNKTFQSIADELKHQYLIGFYPQNMNDGKENPIVVKVNSKEIVVRTKGKISLKVNNE